MVNLEEGQNCIYRDNAKLANILLHHGGEAKNIENRGTHTIQQRNLLGGGKWSLLRNV